MAKKTTTATTTPKIGARGQANLSIVAAAGQRYAPVQVDLSGYMNALGNISEILVARENRALERKEGVNLTDEIKNDVRFGQDLQNKREEALVHIKTMKNTLPFTQKHKEAKAEYEKIKKEIESKPKFFEDTDKKTEALNKVVVIDPTDPSISYINISPLESDEKKNYLLAMHGKEWTTDSMYDPDGDGPKEAFAWVDEKDGNFKIFSGKYDNDGKPLYVPPKDLDFSFVTKDAGKAMNTVIEKFIEDTADPEAFSKAGEYEKAVDGLKNKLNNLKDKNPVGFENMLMTNKFSVEIDGEKKSYNFIDYYLEKTLSANIEDEETKQKLKKLIGTYSADPNKKQAMQSLYKAIKQFDEDFEEDMQTFLDEILRVNEGV